MFSDRDTGTLEEFKVSRGRRDKPGQPQGKPTALQKTRCNWVQFAATGCNALQRASRKSAETSEPRDLGCYDLIHPCSGKQNSQSTGGIFQRPVVTRSLICQRAKDVNPYNSLFIQSDRNYCQIED